MSTSISTALKESKPVYISVSCNLLTTHPTFSREPFPFLLLPSNFSSLWVSEIGHVFVGMSKTDGATASD